MDRLRAWGCRTMRDFATRQLRSRGGVLGTCDESALAGRQAGDCATMWHRKRTRCSAQHQPLRPYGVGLVSASSLVSCPTHWHEKGLGIAPLNRVAQWWPAQNHKGSRADPAPVATATRIRRLRPPSRCPPRSARASTRVRGCVCVHSRECVCVRARAHACACACVRARVHVCETGARPPSRGAPARAPPRT
jgi:hypothetical protein